MRIALIPPTPDLPRAPKTGIHLLLAHLMEDAKYTKFYAERRKKGDYLILDNSAHEKGVGDTFEQGLMEKASFLQAQEVVLPDILFDRRGTIERSKQMLKWIVGKGWEQYVEAGKPRLMIVPQSRVEERADWQVCLRGLLQAWDTYAPRAPEALEAPVIGISKDFDEWRGGLAKLIRDYVVKVFQDRDIDVHCLGWPNDLWSIARVSNEFPWVRSTDSAKAFVYAKNFICLEPGGWVPTYPRRDPDYHTESLNPPQWDLALRNVRVYQACGTNEIIIPEPAL